MEISQQLEKIRRGASEIISEEELTKKLKNSLKSKKPLRIKAGFDPTAPDIHLGHTLLLRKLRVFQDLGHSIFFLIGDFTGRIGDPSGQDKSRPLMTDAEIKKNAATYKEQVFKILDRKKTKIVFNSLWLAKKSAQDLIRLAAYSSVAQLLARADFKQRFEAQREIRLHEFIYPLLQAYDSVHLKADVELGGTDQKFNLLLGRELQAAFKQEPQAIIMLPLLEGLDGINKMSKSQGNYIGINESPKEMFGKLMSISDELMYRYYELLTSEDLAKVKSMHPMEAKKALAQKMVADYHSIKEAEKAKEEFEKVFQKRVMPQDLDEIKITLQGIQKSIYLRGLAHKINLSSNELGRLILQGAVEVNDQVVKDYNYLLEVDKEYIIRIGKKRIFKVKIASLFQR